MFSWASSTFESLAQTVAPPPSDPQTKIYFACQKRDENAVFDILQQNSTTGSNIHPTFTIIYESKGYTLLHLACLYSLSRLLQHCIDQLQQQPPQQPFLSVTDNEGNTPLHCAAMSNQSNALDIIKFLLSIEASNANHPSCPPIVTITNRAGQTPYDVATVNSIRQFLLPLQLQAETQIAINNGGVGLPPGIDLGGLKITNPNLPPPPTSMMMPQQQQPMSHSSSSSSMYAPIPGLNISNTNANNTAASFAPPPPSSSTITTPTPSYMMYPTTPGMTPQDQLYNQPPIQQQLPQRELSSTSLPPSNEEITSTSTTTTITSNTISRPPSSVGSTSGYALTGRSSAAILKTKKGIQPDGFHSSSSDKNLQEKYGHINMTNTSLPPPPSSGNYNPSGNSETTTTPGQNNIIHPMSAPPSMSGAIGNPFAGGLSALGGAAGGRTSVRRYVTYDPLASNRSQQPQQPQPTTIAATNTAQYTPYNQYQPQQQQQPQYQQPQTVFNPAYSSSGALQPQAPVSQEQLPSIGSSNNVSFTLPPNNTVNHNSMTSPVNSYIGKTPANTPMLSSSSSISTATNTSMNIEPATSSSSSFMSPPPSGMMGTSSLVGNTTTTSNYNLQSLVPPKPFVSSSPDRSGSSIGNNAATVFGTPTMVKAPIGQVDTTSSTSASTPDTTLLAQRGFHRSNSTPSDVAALFSSKPVMSTTTTSTANDTEVLPPQPSSTTTANELFSSANSSAQTHYQQPLQPEMPNDTLDPAHNNAQINNNNNNNNHVDDDEDELTDVPLTPGQDAATRLNVASMMNHNSINTTAEISQIQHQQQQPSEQQPTSSVVTNSVNSLIASIGMPPPPFSRK